MSAAEPESGLVVDARLTRGAFTLDVACRIASGTILAVFGANGAGKTTLLHAIAGLVALDDGTITCDDVIVDDGMRTWIAPEHRPVGYVFQDQRLFPHLSALDNVAFGLRARGATTDAARTRAREELGAFGIAPTADLRPDALSGGQAQRVALARVLVTEPRIVLLDEPFAAIDAAARAEIRSVTARRLDAIGAVTVLVTHDVGDAESLTDRAINLAQGRVVAAGTPAAVNAVVKAGSGD